MKIIDRKTNTLIEKESNKAVRFLYNNIVGRMLLKPLTMPVCSKASALYMNSRLSKILIKENRKNYKSYNNYFTRYNEQNIDRTEKHFISPCDAKLMVYELNEKSSFKIKDSIYEVKDLINKDISDYHDGYVLIFRLETTDYHRYCYIDDGYHDANKKIKGCLHTVRPIAVEQKNVFVTNSRSYTVLDTVNFGQVIQIEVGALMVGKIKNNYTNYSFKKGEEKGFFEYGGSTIILLVKKDNVKIDNYLINNTKRGYETKISIGERIGVKKIKEEF